MISFSSLIRPAILVLVPLSIGILARYFNFLESVFDALYKIVVIIILPVLVFGAIAIERPAGILSMGGISSLAIIGLGVTSVAAAIGTHLAGMGREKSTEILLNSVFMNYTFLGLAVVQSVLGPVELSFASIYAVTVGIIHLTLGLVLTKTSTGKKVKPIEILHDILTFPAAFALIVAMLFVFFGAGIPYWTAAEAGMDQFANIASFLMVLAVGYKMKVGHFKEHLSSIFSVGFIRLFIGPLATFGMIKIFGIDLTWNIAQVALLLSAMPPGIFNVILAERFNLDREAYGSEVFYLTVLSLFVVVPLLLHFTLPGFSLI